MTTHKSKTSRFFNSLNNVVTAVMAAPVFGDLIRNVGTPMAEKALKSALGADTESASKSTHDENLFHMVLKEGNLQKTDINKIREFRDELGKHDKEKKEALVLFIAQKVDYFKIITKAKKETPSAPDYSKGIELAISWLNDLMSINSFDDKVKFLDNEGVFQLIPKKKKLLREKLTEANTKISGSRPAKKISTELSEGKKVLTETMDDLAVWLDSKSAKK